MMFVTEATRWRMGWRMMHTKTVLVVDDDPALLDLLRMVLEDEGYRVLTAVGREAISAALAKRPDVILLDLVMLGMDGVHVSERLHAMRTTTRIPIIAMSTPERLRALAPGLPIVDQLPKPFDVEQLYARVARWADEP